MHRFEDLAMRVHVSLCFSPRLQEVPLDELQAALLGRPDMPEALSSWLVRRWQVCCMLRSFGRETLPIFTPAV